MTTPNAAPVDVPLGRRILVVDDEPVIRRIVDLVLSAAGFAVFEAEDAARAIQAVKLAAQPFDLILLDLTLPDGDGAAVIPAIRQLSSSSRLLVVSGLGAMDASDFGADGYLAKPFTKSSLLSAVERALANGTMPAEKPRTAE
jgi:DNA-binding response OmpR family regulator